MASTSKVVHLADIDQIERVTRAVNGLDTAGIANWQDVDVLSHHTILDGVRAHPGGILATGDTFHGIMTVHVALCYGTGDEAFTTADSFPGAFHGHFQDGVPVIDEATVDPSVFYA